MLCAKNYQNRSVFHEVIQKMKVAPFLEHNVDRGINASAHFVKKNWDASSIHY